MTQLVWIHDATDFGCAVNLSFKQRNEEIAGRSIPHTDANQEAQLRWARAVGVNLGFARSVCSDRGTREERTRGMLV